MPGHGKENETRGPDRIMGRSYLRLDGLSNPPLRH